MGNKRTPSRKLLIHFIFDNLIPLILLSFIGGGIMTLFVGSWEIGYLLITLFLGLYFMWTRWINPYPMSLSAQDVAGWGVLVLGGAILIYSIFYVARIVWPYIVQWNWPIIGIGIFLFAAYYFWAIWDDKRKGY